MKILGRLLLGALVIAFGIWLWTILFPSPEKLIRKRIAEVARRASFSQGENVVKQGLRITGLVSCFAETVEVMVDLPGNQQHQIAGRSEISELAVNARGLRWLKIELLDPNVVLSPDKESAVVNLTAKVTFPDQRDFIVQEMKFTLKKFDREWLIIRIETVRTLSRAQPRGSLAVCSSLNRDLDLSLNLSVYVHEQIKSKRTIRNTNVHGTV